MRTEPAPVCQQDVYAAATHTAQETAPERSGPLSLRSASVEIARHPRAIRRLNERRRATVRLVMDCGPLLAQQIQTALYPLGPTNRTACQRNLTALVRDRYLDTLPRERPTEPLIYVLSRRSVRGNRLMRAEAGKAVLAGAHQRAGTVAHTLAVNEVRVRALRACRELDWTLAGWRGPVELAPLLRGEQLIPDAYFQVLRSDPVLGQTRTAGFFVELERAYKSSRVLCAKLEKYVALYDSGRYRELFGTRSLRLLVVCCGDAGVAATTRVRSGLGEARRADASFSRFTSLEAIEQLPPRGLLVDPIWGAPGDERPVALFTVEPSPP